MHGILCLTQVIQLTTVDCVIRQFNLTVRETILLGVCESSSGRIIGRAVSAMFRKELQMVFNNLFVIYIYIYMCVCVCVCVCVHAHIYIVLGNVTPHLAVRLGTIFGRLPVQEDAEE